MYYKLIDMQLTGFKMMESKIKKVQYKLSQHRVLGEKSPLSILQVARLMDKLNNKNDDSNKEYQFSLN